MTIIWLIHLHSIIYKRTREEETSKLM